MASTSRLTSRAPSRLRRAVGYIWFCAVGIPFMMLAGVFAYDASQVIIVHREVYLAAESSALAGAGGQLDASGALVPDSASSLADETFALEQGSGNASYPSATYPSAIRGATVVSTSVNVTSDTVTYTVTYTVNDLLFSGFFDAAASQQQFTVSSTSFVCHPGDPNNPTHGLCTHPVTIS
jgi:hypothetical protein